MRKKLVIKIVLSCAMLVIMCPITLVHAADEINGDLTYDEGAEIYKPTDEEIREDERRQNEVKLKEMLRAAPDGEKRTMDVPVFQQKNNYYCGPATVKQVLHYRNKSSKTQEYYAGELGTTQSGTDMTKIKALLNRLQNAPYIYANIGTSSEWLTKIKYSCSTTIPAVLDINTNSVSAFPYRSSGHFVNISGLNTLDGHCKVRITDPYGPGLGNRWYYSSDLYKANYNHSRKAIIY
ncbi:C39 family peptidase [Candidatus Stoquefichus sp. SB1]|uniref:C39 family peptidase n=1 Tax=Candidatus Stoquefichus sp. SB1 TaxID=1658109 RepID=UPI00067E7C3D|nr:C39 family peptidase [Candidatus Stoquefichus sp. SB1]